MRIATLSFLLSLGLILDLAILCPSCPGLAWGVLAYTIEPVDGRATMRADVCSGQAPARCVARAACAPQSCCPAEPDQPDEPETPANRIPLGCVLLCLQYVLDETELVEADIPNTSERLVRLPAVLASIAIPPAWRHARVEPHVRGSPRIGPLRPILCVWRN